METSIDTQIEQALSFARYQTSLNQQRKLLKEQFESATILPYNGGLFKITQEWLGGFDKESNWVLDINSNPIHVENPTELYESAKETYRNAIATYGEEYQKLRRQRSVRSLVEL